LWIQDLAAEAKKSVIKMEGVKSVLEQWNVPSAMPPDWRFEMPGVVRGRILTANLLSRFGRAQS
jgi:hypothetical protein